MPTYTAAPLPFIGQKRRFIKPFKKALSHIENDGEGWTIIDVFGGSGLLAHVAKKQKPAACVIYNDFDDYSTRLKHIDDTNRLRRIIFDIVKDIPKDTKLDAATKQQVIDAINHFDGFVDLACVRSWLLFSAKQLDAVKDLNKATLYHCVKAYDYKNADGYLDGLVVVHQSFEALLEKYKDTPKVLLVLDPPYVNTSQNTYHNGRYFGMVQFLTLMHYVRPPFVIFSSVRSEVLDYIDHLKRYDADQYARFKHMQTLRFMSTLAHNARYEDNVLYKF